MRNNKLLSVMAVVFAFVANQGACCRPAHGKSKAPACASAYERAQELRKAAKLQAAREMLQVCAQDTCGKFIQRECAVWLEELEQELPSVTLSVKDAAGAPLHDVEVSLDGVSLGSALQGAAVAVDPGPREFRFKAKGHAELVHQVSIHEGQQNLPVEVQLRKRVSRAPVTEPGSTPAAAAVTKDAAVGSSTSIAPYVIGGVGGLGFVGFAVLGMMGRNAHRELGECWPDCSRANVDRVSTLYAAANVSLGVGVVGIGTATVLLLTSRASSPARTVSLPRSKQLHAIDVRQTRGGLVAELRGTF